MIRSDFGTVTAWNHPRRGRAVFSLRVVVRFGTGFLFAGAKSSASAHKIATSCPILGTVKRPFLKMRLILILLVTLLVGTKYGDGRLHGGQAASKNEQVGQWIPVDLSHRHLFRVSNVLLTLILHAVDFSDEGWNGTIRP